MSQGAMLYHKHYFGLEGAGVITSIGHSITTGRASDQILVYIRVDFANHCRIL